MICSGFSFYEHRALNLLSDGLSVYEQISRLHRSF
jgi:hypothetical protein